MNKKVLFVSGASSDVGLNLISTVADEYDYIWAHYRSDHSRFDELREKYPEKIRPICCDYASLEETQDMISVIQESEFQPNHFVFLPSPPVVNEHFHKTNWFRWEDEINCTLRSSVLILKAFVKRMSKEKNGRIIFLLTSYTNGVPPKYISSYVTVKYALLGLMKELSAEYANKGITVNGISPDMMETRFVSNMSHVVIEENASQNPLGRNVKLDDIMGMFRLLLSDDGEAITGQNIIISGGLR